MALVRSRIATFVAAVGLFVAACIAGDHGAARAAVGDATGPLVGTSADGAAILAAQGMAPGDAHSGEITVTNVGDQSGAFALGSEATADSGAGLAHELDLAVEDVTPGRARTVVFTGKLADLSNVALGSMAQGEAHRYRFTVSLPRAAGNAYQGASTAVTFVWRATGGSTAATPTTPATTPAPAAAAAGPGTLPRATLSARARQSAAKHAVDAYVSCQIGCTAVVSGTATAGKERFALRTVHKTLKAPGRVHVRLALPRGARDALAAHHTVVVRLRLKANLGTRTVTGRRTVRIVPPRA